MVQFDSATIFGTTKYPNTILCNIDGKNVQTILYIIQTREFDQDMQHLILLSPHEMSTSRDTAYLKQFLPYTPGQ